MTLVIGVLAVGGFVKNRYEDGEAQPPTRLLGGKCSEPRSASEHATSTSRQNCVQIQYLNPSRLEPVARAYGGVHASQVNQEAERLF